MLTDHATICFTTSVPIYEYECAKGHRFEAIQKISDPPLKKCEKCKSKTERLISSPSIQFKGTGWYVTDYAKKGSGSDEAKSESGGDKAKSESGGDKAKSESGGDKAKSESGGDKAKSKSSEKKSSDKGSGNKSD
jgi:putative FmdB family regulatory protein